MNKSWLLLGVLLFSLLVVGIVVLQNRLKSDLEHADQHASSLLNFYGMLLQERLQAKDFQQARDMVEMLGKNIPDLVEIRLQSANGFELAHYRDASARALFIKKSTSIDYSYTGKAELTIYVSTAHIYHVSNILQETFLLGYLFIAMVLIYLVRVNSRDRERTQALLSENEKRLAAENELIRHREHLQEIVRERTVELEQARDAAMSANQAKSDFLASVSHELRTPLNSIIGFVSLMKNGVSGELNQVQVKQLEIVFRSSHHLLSLINDILDLSKIEAGEMDLSVSAFSINEMFDEVESVVLNLVAEKGLQFVRQTDKAPAFINTDRKRLLQSVLNLLSNAVKFTDQGTITLSSYVDDQNLIIYVNDTGQGIDESQHEEVFQAFKQLESGNTRRFTGTGLGLAITRRYVEMMGGRIVLRSSKGNGAKFIMIFPLALLVGSNAGGFKDIDRQQASQA